MKQFFKDEESTCGSVKTGFKTHVDGIQVTTWDCGCKTYHYPDGDSVHWCGWLKGNIYRQLPGVFEPFVADEIKMPGNRNGRKMYQK